MQSSTKQLAAGAAVCLLSVERKLERQRLKRVKPLRLPGGNWGVGGLVQFTSPHFSFSLCHSTQLVSSIGQLAVEQLEAIIQPVWCFAPAKIFKFKIMLLVKSTWTLAKHCATCIQGLSYHNCLKLHRRDKHETCHESATAVRKNPWDNCEELTVT